MCSVAEGRGTSFWRHHAPAIGTSCRLPLAGTAWHHRLCLSPQVGRGQLGGDIRQGHLSPGQTLLWDFPGHPAVDYCHFLARTRRLWTNPGGSCALQMLYHIEERVKNTEDENALVSHWPPRPPSETAPVA